MYTSSFVNVFSGNVVNPSPVGLNRLTLDRDLTLSWPTQFQDTNNVCSIILDVTPDQDDRVLTIPDARFVSNGQSIYIANATEFSFVLNKSDDTLLSNINANSFYFFYLLDNTTAGGLWRVSPFGGGATSVTSVAAVSLSDNLVITGSPITTAGTFEFDFANPSNLRSLSLLDVPGGLTTLTAANTFTLRTITGTGNQIVVVNGGGVLGNPTLSLDPNITGLTTITVGNLMLTGNQVRATNANGHVALAPLGSGSVDIYNNPAAANYNSFVSSAALAQNIALQLPTTTPLAGQVLTATSAVSPYPLGWSNVATIDGGATVNAIPRFETVGGSLKDSAVFIDDNNNISLGTFVSPGGVSNALILGDNQQLRLAELDGNTISVTVGEIRLQPASGQTVEIGSSTLNESASINMYSGDGINFRNEANTQTVGLFASNATSTYQLYLPNTNGAINTLLYSTDGVGQLGFTTSPLTTAGISRAWALVASGGGVTVGHNVASAVRNSAGNYTITFTSAFSGANYVITFALFTAAGIIYATNRLAASFVVNVTDPTGVTPTDSEFSFCCFGS